MPKDEKLHDTEDKNWWVIHGADREQTFVKEICPKIGLQATINPQKAVDPYSFDLVVGGNKADLKCQETPFFVAGPKYGISAKYAVTFNKKDLLRYQELYPDIEIYYWVNWQTTEKKIYNKVFRVEPLTGVWKAPLSRIEHCIEEKEAPLHRYQRRVGDKHGNARDSYILDLRWFECVWLKE